MSFEIIEAISDAPLQLDDDCEQLHAGGRPVQMTAM